MQKKINLLSVIQFRRKFEFYNKTLMLAVVNFTVQIECKISKSTIYICASIPRYSFKYHFIMVFSKLSNLEVLYGL
jgi:hypothetical protein